MITNDLTIDLAQLGLNIEKTIANVAAENIAFSNIRKTTKVVDFDNLISKIVSSLEIDDLSSASKIIREEGRETSSNVKISTASVSLDSEITQLSGATGRYKIISESLSRKFGLMSLAVSGR